MNRIRLEHDTLTLGDGQAAVAAGIRFVHQDLGLVGSLNAVENIALSAGYQTGRGQRIHWRDEVRRAREALAGIGLDDVDVKAPVDSLPPSQRTGVAIARALVGWEQGAHLLVLDEPTATLPGDDVQRLFDVIHRLKARGVSILYVSHHLDEVFELADRVTVLRDGKRIATVPVGELDYPGLISLIVGHHVELGSASTHDATGAPLLTVRGLQGDTVHGVDFEVSPGEIVGFAGITGSGREHVLGLVVGQIPSADGVVLLDGELIENYDPRHAMDSGIAFVPAERAIRGVIQTMNVRENSSVSDLGRHYRGGRLRHRAERAEMREWVERLSIKTAGTEAMIGALSGGNQQKVVFSKALRLSPKLLVLDEPTQGIDVGAKDQIHRLIDEAAASGMATLVSSTDTEELVRLCHRVLVMVDGKVKATLVGADITPERIGHLQLEGSRKAS